MEAARVACSHEAARTEHHPAGADVGGWGRWLLWQPPGWLSQPPAPHIGPPPTARPPLTTPRPTNNATPAPNPPAAPAPPAAPRPPPAAALPADPRFRPLDAAAPPPSAAPQRAGETHPPSVCPNGPPPSRDARLRS